MALCLVALLAACDGNDPTPIGSEGARGAPIVERDVAVPMRDGVVLRADVYRPAEPGTVPVLVYRTPYGKHSAAQDYDTHLRALERGYAVVLQDVRGRHASEGRFDPYRQEGRDGYDTVEWAATQPWSNGDVGTFGLSYPGAVQWLAALEAPPHLRAMVPAMTYSSARQFFYMGGIFDSSWLPWIYLNIAPDLRRRLDLPGVRDTAEADRAWPEVAAEMRDWLPLAELPHLREVAPFYYEWLRHPPEDPWWEWAEVRGHYDRVDPSVAVLHLSGWYDEGYGPEGAITNFTGLRAARARLGDLAALGPRSHLVLGPWTHGVGATESSRAGEVDFGLEAAIDYDDLVLDFFDHYLRGADNELARAPAVRQFVMGENRWHEHREWPPEGTTSRTLRLAAGGELLAPGASSAVAGATSSFFSDPRAPLRDPYGSLGAYDYRELLGRPDLLVFETVPLEDDLLVVGRITAVVHAACDCRDFDLWVRVLDVHPDGRALNLMSPGADAVRASYREPGLGRQPVELDRVYELELAGLLTSNLFLAGHRIRVQISGAFAPHLSRNLQTGESEVSSAEARAATITLYHDAAHPSRLELPVLPSVR